MIIPNFEIKDSYIVKNLLNYNTALSASSYGIMFTDYDLARKTQVFNSETFDNILLTGSTTGLPQFNSMTISYYDTIYSVYFDKNVSYTDIVTTSTFVNSNEHQEYFVDNTNLPDFSIGDYLSIEFYKSQYVSGTTNWYHSGSAGETWFVSGYTHQTFYEETTGSTGTIFVPYDAENYYWEVTGTTTTDGNSSGTTFYEFYEPIPIFKYSTVIININGNQIYVEKLIEDYLYNDIFNNYTDVNYKITNLNHCINTYFDISDTLKKTILGDYVDITINENLTIIPFRNENDIYFNYDNISFEFIGSGIDEIYKFNTDIIYNKYNLENLDRKSVV
jgi:hypothetical protein